MKIKFDDESEEETIFKGLGEKTYNKILEFARKQITEDRESADDIDADEEDE